MDLKKIKVLLKKANTSVMNKDYIETEKICQDILKENSTNYMATIFLGAAWDGLEKINESFEMYKQATVIDPEQILAWQGLSKLYERYSKQLSKYNSYFIDVFEKLNQLLKGNEKKQLENLMNLCRLQYQVGKYELFFETFRKCTSSPDWATIDIESLIILWKFIFNLFKSYFKEVNFDREKLIFLRESCENILKSNVTSEIEKIDSWKCLVDITFIMENSENSWDICFNRCPVSNSIAYFELLIQIYLDNFPSALGTENIESLVKGLSLLDSENIILKKFTLHKEFIGGEVKICKELFHNVFQNCSECVFFHNLYSKYLYKIHNFKMSLEISSNALKILTKEKPMVIFYGDSSKYKTDIELLKIKCLLRLSNKTMWQKAYEFLENELENDTLKEYKNELYIYFLHTYLKLDLITEFEKLNAILIESLIKSSEFLLVQGYYHRHKMDYDEALKCFETALLMDANLADAHLHKSLIYWNDIIEGEENGKENNDSNELTKKLFLASIIKTIQLDPYEAQSFMYLGHYYSKISLNNGKACPYYEKAFDLDPSDEENNKSLINCLIALSSQKTLLYYLNKIVEINSPGCPKWVLLRLGTYYSKQADFTEAIINFQATVRMDPKDLHCWERLGEAYMNRGSYNSALKAFTKVTENDPTAIYSFYQIAKIKQIIGLYKESIDHFSKVLQLNPNYLPILQGLGESRLQLARTYLNKFLFKRAQTEINQAILFLTRGLNQRSDFSCIWKTLGDVFILAYRMSNEICFEVPMFLQNNDRTISLELSENDMKTSSIRTKVELLAISTRCYSMASKLQPNISLLWHDLGMSYYYQLMIVSQHTISDKLQFVKQLAGKTYQCFRKAVSLNTLNHNHWNALGLLALSNVVADYSLAQHCFIKSIEADSHNNVAWSNLGFLYLLKNQLKPANEAFKVSQSLCPLFVNGWIGQASIAEIIGHSEAMDLFRHSVQTANHVESMLSYSHWVCKTLADKSKLKKSSSCLKKAFENMHAVQVAIEAMAKYSDARSDNYIGWNFYGLLLEKQHLCRSSLDAFSRSFNLLPNIKEPDLLNFQKVQVNYARLLCKNGKFEESLEVYKKILKIASPGEIFSLKCQTAHALYKTKLYRECIEVYEEASSMTKNDDHLREISIAQGICFYMLNDIHSAKMNLFKHISSVPTQSKCDINLPASFLKCLQSIFCFGLLQKDMELIRIILLEVNKLGSFYINMSSHLSMLMARAYYIQGDTNKGIAVLCKSIHVKPDLHACWTKLAVFLLNCNSMRDCNLLATICSQSSMEKDNSSYKISLQCLSIISLYDSFISIQNASNSSRCENSKKITSPIKIAQRLVHLFPEKMQNWCILLSSCQKQIFQDKANSFDLALNLEKFKNISDFCINISKHIMIQVEALLTFDRDNDYFKSLHHWLTRQYLIYLILDRQIQLAAQFLQNAMWSYEEDVYFNQLNAYLNNDISSIQSLIPDDKTSNSLKILCALLIKNKSENSKNIYEKLIQSSSCFPNGSSIKKLVENCFI